MCFTVQLSMFSCVFAVRRVSLTAATSTTLRLSYRIVNNFFDLFLYIIFLLCFSCLSLIFRLYLVFHCKIKAGFPRPLAVSFIGLPHEIKKNVASDILAPSADATHLHIARVRILRSVLSHGKFGGISYEIKPKTAADPLHCVRRGSRFTFSSVFPLCGTLPHRRFFYIIVLPETVRLSLR